MNSRLGGDTNTGSVSPLDLIKFIIQFDKTFTHQIGLGLCKFFVVPTQRNPDRVNWVWIFEEKKLL